MGGLKSCMMVFMMMTMVASSMAQTRHVVGDSLGWNIPSNGAAAYTDWAAQQNFTVGDTLVFNFPTGAHNVAQVSSAAYGPCTTANPISLTTTGPATLTLTTAGPHYYICTVGSHCQSGQKLTINVSAAAPTTPPPAATPTTPPPAATPTTPPPAATPTTPPPAATPTPAPTPATTPTPAPTPATTPTTSPAPSPADLSSPPAPPTPGPSPTGSTSPPSPGSTTPAPPSNAAASLTVVVPATFLAVGLALFY